MTSRLLEQCERQENQLEKSQEASDTITNASRIGVGDETILETYKRGFTMMQTAKRLDVTLDRVRSVVLKNSAGRLTACDRAYLNTYVHAPLVPARKR